MAPKLSTLRLSQAVEPRIVPGVHMVPLMEISIGDDSGWRAIDLQRKEELVASFLGGQFGKSILRSALLRNVGGKSKLGLDGLKLLIDGKVTVAALLDCFSVYNKMKCDEGKNHDDQVEDENLEFPENLVKIFEEGLECRIGEFENDSDDVVFAYCVGIHDADANKYKPSTLQDCVKVSTRFKERAPGGSWESTRQAMLAFYGSGKRMWVYRSIVCAQTLSASVLETLAKENIPNKWICENPSCTLAERVSARRTSISRRSNGGRAMQTDAARLALRSTRTTTLS